MTRCIRNTATVLIALSALTGTVSAFSSNQQTVTLKRVSDDRITIRIGDMPFAVLNYGADLPKPYLLPVQTAGGIVVNRELNDATDPDHPHHKGLWVSVDEVNGLKFWNEDAPIVNRAATILTTGTPVGQLLLTNEWRHPETGAPQLTETTVISIHANRLMVCDIHLMATHGAVTFDDTKEGLLGFRLAPSMKERNGGRIVASDGTTGESECWGKAFPWIDYCGEVDGKTAGVTLMDHPSNPRPSRYHVRAYGLFAINPFGEHSYTRGTNEAAPVHLAPGGTLRLRYGVYFHDGDTANGHVAEVWKQFVDVAAH